MAKLLLNRVSIWLCSDVQIVTANYAVNTSFSKFMFCISLFKRARIV